MSTMQNLKNFIRGGKNARNTHSPHAEATTNVSNVHAQQQRYNNYAPPPAAPHAGISEPNVAEHRSGAHDLPQGAAGGFSVAASDNRDRVAKANDAAARAAEGHQKLHEQSRDKSNKKQDYDPSVIERIVAEERESKGKMPRYPGLERWTLIEKMGDGAFSNVYRAKDTAGQYAEVAIKVVRKFEMNSSQVSTLMDPPDNSRKAASQYCPLLQTQSPSSRSVSTSYGHPLDRRHQQLYVGRRSPSSRLQSQQRDEDRGGAHIDIPFSALEATIAVHHRCLFDDVLYQDHG